ncbi:MAG: methyltransferase domain-containing protein [Cyanobacteria bacterium P01_H01_bin.15]
MFEMLDSTLLFPVKTLDQSRYIETFAAFVERSSEYPAMIQRLSKTFNSLAENFTCLDIGAGTGKVIQDCLSTGCKQPGNYVAIEPNSTHADSLRKTILSENIEAEIFEQEFNSRFPIPNTYDLILFSHSLYWLSDPVACVRLAYKALRPGGCVLIFIGGPFSFYTFFHLFNPLFERDRPILPDHGFSSHELVYGLRSAGFEPDISFDSTQLDLTDLFEKKQEKNRDEFLSFCLQIEFSELQEPVKSDAINFVKNSCINYEDQIRWPHPSVTIYLTKR